MPDASGYGHQDPTAPMSWHDAFAALPLESAAPPAWERLRGRLPTPAAAPLRRRWPLWLAAAASLFAVVVIPLRMEPDTATPPSRADGSISSASVALPKPSSITTEPARDATSSQLPGATHLPGQDEPPATIAVERPRRAAIAGAGNATGIRPAPAEPDLEALYAESAQLEALLAMARDDHTASSGTAALTASFDTALAAIDAALIQPGLDTSHRTGLWHRRVDTLRQLAGIETTRRLLSARGETYDAALVSID